MADTGVDEQEDSDELAVVVVGRALVDTEAGETSSVPDATNFLPTAILNSFQEPSIRSAIDFLVLVVVVVVTVVVNTGTCVAVETVVLLDVEGDCCEEA